MNEKILIIDDEEDVCEALKESLIREGHEAEICHTGAEAMTLMETKAYDLVLIDIRLEGRISGIDLLRYSAALPHKPIIVVESATPKKQLEEILKKEGVSERVDRILEKPSDLRLDHFNCFIEQVLSKERG
jgi:CheY-like chemotaxis protein